MTEREMQFTGYTEELNIKFIENILKRSKAVQFKNHKDIIIFHPCVKEPQPYQITYIWKKDNKPSGDIVLFNLYRCAKEINMMLNHQKEYYPKKIIKKRGKINV